MPLRFSKDVRALNGDILDVLTVRQASAKHEDVADVLLAEMRRLAPDMPQPIRDCRFLTFKIDLAYPALLLAIEVDGGQAMARGGRHGGNRDYQKTRELTLAGWRLLRFTSNEVRTDPLRCIEDIRRGLAMDDGRLRRDAVAAMEAMGR